MSHFAVISALRSILPPHSVVFQSPGLDPYTHDYSPGMKQIPLAVVCPQTDEEIGQILHIVRQFHVPVVVRGAGTGTTGGALSDGGIVLSMERMNRLLEVDVANRFAVAEPGVVTATLQKAVEVHGLFYPPDPASSDMCTLGGNIAENAGGPCCMKYGVTRDYVAGLEGFWADGTAFRLGGKTHKNVAGYDLIRLLVGSEGTLAVITKMILRLLPLPPVRIAVLVDFSDYWQSLDVLPVLMSAGVDLAAAEFVDTATFEAVCLYRGRPIPPSPAPAQFLFEVHGFSAAGVDEQLQRLQRVISEKGGHLVQTGRTSAERASIWQGRRDISLALRARYPQKLSYDIVVPPHQISDYLLGLRHLERQVVGVKLIGYGHLGDGNIHVNLLPDPRLGAEADLLRDLEKKILELAVSLGGTITGEHGIGLTRKPYLPLVCDETTLRLQREIKSIFDPENLLNPGKGI